MRGGSRFERRWESANADRARRSRARIWCGRPCAQAPQDPATLHRRAARRGRRAAVPALPPPRTTQQSEFASLQFKPVAHLKIDLARIGVVRAAESRAVVEQEPAVAGIERACGNSQKLTERPADRNIARVVPFEVRGKFAGTVREPRAVIPVRACQHFAGECEIEAGMESVALIV